MITESITKFFNCYSDGIIFIFFIVKLWKQIHDHFFPLQITIQLSMILYRLKNKTLYFFYNDIGRYCKMIKIVNLKKIF